MHQEILTKEQIELLPLLKNFAKEFYLVGGTAIALHIGHRRSIDFDLFTSGKIKRKNIKNLIEKTKFSISEILFEDFEQLHIVVNNVKITFFTFEHKIEPTLDFDNIIKIPSLLDLSAMKAFALGGRAKWKDYVDLYFILKNHFSFKDITARANSLFKEFFNEKLFREQLSYFKDIDYEEKVEFVTGEVSENKVKKFLTEVAVSPI
ncbi:MAG: nucleotidyl transferase AbiEii/AbiGii toxin family protein [FCB group bacterium]|jgi:hypothetical protein